jgi:2-polyprenyl-3-methyl-5-hydroxy-6-metoxy-1,4-benzoquinol methylase
MLTDDKNITTPGYWNKVYAGANNNAKVDASNTKRPANAFDRFSWVAKYAEGPNVLGVASGHAHIEKRIKAANPKWHVVASDQASEAIDVSKYKPYWKLSAYKLFPCLAYEEPVKWNTIIIAQAMEYLEDQQAFLKEAQRVSEKIIITVPLGEMAKWSQLRIYTEENVKELLAPFGVIEAFERVDDLLLIKLKFND